MPRTELIRSFFDSMDAMARIAAMQNKSDRLPQEMPPHAQLGVLFIVSHRGPLTIKELSQQFGMTSSAATQLVNGLVKSGLLEREEDVTDRRKIRVALTGKGKKVLAQAKEYRTKKMTAMFEPLSDAELTQLLKIQTKIIEHWKETCLKPLNK